MISNSPEDDETLLQDLIELWPGGPSIALGNYLVYFKYLFFLLALIFAAGTFFRPRRAWLLMGPLVLAFAGLFAFGLPLARPYGVTEQARGIEDLGNIMVIATRGAPTEGRLVEQSNPHPLWGSFLAMLSGRDAERLWRLYRFVPWMSLFALWLAAVFVASGLHSEDALPRGTLPGLAAFFVLLLSSHRLSFLEPDSTFWEAVLWDAPHRGVALGAACLCVGWLAKGSLPASIASAASLAFAGWIDPHICLATAIGTLPWILAGRRWRQAIIVVAGLVFVFSFRTPLEPVALPDQLGSWPDALVRISSVSLELGLVFLLAVIGVMLMLRAQRATESLFATFGIAVFWLFVLASSVRAAAQVFDPASVGALLRLWIAVAAAYGLFRGLVHLGRFQPTVPEEWSSVPRFLRGHSTPRAALSAFFLFSLPWCLPYWWAPTDMDPTYVASLAPISGNVLAMGDAVREKTGPDDVFVAGPSYAPWIPATAGRRVVFAGGSPPDREARVKALLDFTQSKSAAAIGDAASAWSITHLAWGRLDQRSLDSGQPLIDFRFFERSPLFEEEFRIRRWVRIFRFDPSGAN